MSKTRIQIYGEAYVKVIGHLISTLPEDQQEDYKRRFIAEMKTYCVKPRKKTDPPNDEDQSELLNWAPIHCQLFGRCAQASES